MLITGYNYIAAFLTFSCNSKCPYCITRLDGLCHKENAKGVDWVHLINSMEVPEDVPITLQGGEPTLHPDFYEIVNNIKKEISLNLMTNLQFNIKKFTQKIKTDKFYRKAPFPSIRVSYHIGQIKREKIIYKVKEMTDMGYSIGLYMLDHPKNQEEIRIVSEKCLKLGVDFRLKEYLDRQSDKSIFKYNIEKDLPVKCKISDLIIGPDLCFYRCHYDLYTGKNPIPLRNQPDWILCNYPTRCNPCDLKIKNNRYQKWGHCSVEIEKI